MVIKKITEEDLDELISFGISQYPERKNTYSNLVKFVLRNRLNEHTGVSAIFDGEKIRGQNFFTETTLYFKDEKYHTSWGYELIVEPKLREQAWGAELLIANRKLFPGTCATGSGPEALKLNYKMGSYLVGEIRKYIGLSSFLRTPINFLPSKQNYPFKINDFTLIEDIRDFNESGIFNRELVEPDRNKDWIKWRYFTKDFKNYNLYQNSNKDWFVVRIIKLKGLKFLLISDYRCDLNDKNSFNNIYCAVKKIANIMRAPFILCSSTHKNVDMILEKAHARSFGRPRPVIFPRKIKSWGNDEKIKSRDFIFVTFGDSDGEWNW